jgi:hypothetical protein
MDGGELAGLVSVFRLQRDHLGRKKATIGVLVREQEST